MKKKIMIFMLLVAVLIGMVRPDPARAETGVTEITDCGLYFDRDTYKIYDDWGNELVVPAHLQAKLEAGQRCLITVQGDGDGTTYFFIWTYESVYDLCCIPCGCSPVGLSDNTFVFLCDGEIVSNEIVSTVARYQFNYIKTDGAITNINYQKVSETWDVSASTSVGGAEYFSVVSNAMEIIYSDIDIFSAVYDKTANVVNVDFNGALFYDADNYDVREFCKDAGLSCSSSANESSSVIPFWFNKNYMYYVVRNINGTSGYEWELYMIYNSSDSQHWLYYTDTGNSSGALGLGTASDTKQTITFRRFYYDSAGGGWLLNEFTSYDVSSDVPVENIGIVVSDSKQLVFASHDIYAFSDGAVVWYEKSTDYTEAEIGGTGDGSEGEEDIEPTLTPTPSGGSSSGGGRPGTSNRPSVKIGGDAEPGSGLDFIVTLYSMLWSRVFSIPMNVDGYSISMQQIVVYGALAVIVGGAVYMFLTGRKR